MNMIQAQQRYINRVNSCHQGHRNRVHKSAQSELSMWLKANGYQAMREQIINDAIDMANLEKNCDD